MSNRNSSIKTAAKPATTTGAASPTALKSDGPTFRATFVEANNGLQTEKRVHGRRGFPARTGHQPNLGETWLVSVSGENHKRTVHFVKCLELISKGVGDKHGVKGDIKANTTSGAATSVKAAPVTPPVKPRPQFLPGQLDVVQRVRAWLAPAPTTADLSNLRFAVAHKRSSESAEGKALRSELATAIARLDTVDEQVAAISLELDRGKKLGGNLHGVSFELFESRREMARLVDEKTALTRETLDYARLVKRTNALSPTCAEYEGLCAQKAAVKEALDTKRAGHNTAMAAGKNRLSDAELGKVFSYDDELVETLASKFAEKEMINAVRAALVTDLAGALSRFENYVSSVV